MSSTRSNGSVLSRKQKLNFVKDARLASKKQKIGPDKVKDKTETERVSLQKSFPRIFNIKNEMYAYVREFFSDNSRLRDGRPDLYRLLHLERVLSIKFNNADFFFIRKITSDFIKIIKKNKILSHNTTLKGTEVIFESPTLSVIIIFSPCSIVEDNDKFLNFENVQCGIFTDKIVLIPHHSRCNDLLKSYDSCKDYANYCKILITAISTFIRKYDSVNSIYGYHIIIIVQFIGITVPCYKFMFDDDFYRYCKNNDIRVDTRKLIFA